MATEVKYYWLSRTIYQMICTYIYIYIYINKSYFPSCSGHAASQTPTSIWRGGARSPPKPPSPNGGLKAALSRDHLPLGPRNSPPFVFNPPRPNLMTITRSSWIILPASSLILQAGLKGPRPGGPHEPLGPGPVPSPFLGAGSGPEAQPEGLLIPLEGLLSNFEYVTCARWGGDHLLCVQCAGKHRSSMFYFPLWNV